MRVGVIINTSWNVYNFRMGLLQALKKEGFDVFVIAPSDEYSDRIRQEGFEFHNIEMDNKGGNPMRDFQLMKTLKEVYQKLRLESVLHFTIKPNIYGSFAAKSLKIPAINNVSGLGTVFLHDSLTTRVAKILYKRAFKSPYKVFFQNADDRKVFLKKGLVEESRTGLLPGSGVDLNRLKAVPLPENQVFTFVMVARLLYDKGIIEMIEAIQKLRTDGAEFKVVLCGAVESTSRLGVNENEVESWVKKGWVEYLGVVDNVDEIIASSDCVVLPSYREGTPKSLLEAAAIGRPIVTTDVPGCREVVVDNGNGFLCTAQNATSLAETLKKMIELPKSKRQAMATQGRKMVEEKFDEVIVINQYLEVLKSIKNGN